MKNTLFFCKYGDEIRAVSFDSEGKREDTPTYNYRDKNWKIVEFGLERFGARSLVGNVYKGKVVNTLPSLEAVFVDIGLSKNGFLHLTAHNKNLKAGDEIIVQVTRDPIKSKGCRLSQDISFAGRVLVWKPFGSGVNVSQKISKDRKKYQSYFPKLKGGVIIRTAGENVDAETFRREVQYLQALWKVIQKRSEKDNHKTLYQELPMPIRWLREARDNQLDTILTNDQEIFKELQTFLSRIAPQHQHRIKKVDDKLWKNSGAQKEWESNLLKTLVQAEGVELVIQRTEAMTVIDVNSAGYKNNKGSFQDTILGSNTIAAKEIARQIRLRDIGGIIVVDFIDMIEKNRKKIEQLMQQLLENDRAKVMILPISELGLMQISRQNLSASVEDLISGVCEECQGEGYEVSPESLARDVWMKLKSDSSIPKKIILQAPEEVVEWLSNNQYHKLKEIEKDTKKKITLTRGELDIKKFSEDIAFPVKIGEEVWIQVRQPHMYHEEDAIAFMGAYPITVRGGINKLGNGVLVKIIEVKPGHAVAKMIDNISTPIQEK